jgi:hypothetical protein
MSKAWAYSTIALLLNTIYSITCVELDHQPIVGIPKPLVSDPWVYLPDIQ